MANVDINEELQRLGSKFERLISLHEQKRAECAKLHAEKLHAETLIDEQSKAIAELTSENQKLLLSEVFLETSINKNKAKEKIDKIVQEIDKCISLFNKQMLK